ncbi:MAG: hypothetical protein M1818_001177 [Claussenomyces sp. TS43310]|nr:MAG: hypothetical protein M1818_001177 [Claussenomyces sp. TS43310]
MTTVEESTTSSAEAAPLTANKPKRVRTGCLTCRERHLKCDEGLPTCLNCRKSSRACKRGVRLNFIDTKIRSPPVIPPGADWAVQFQDESREIASEYKGGLVRYAAVDQIMTPPSEPAGDYTARMVPVDPQMTLHDAVPSMVQPGAPGLYPEAGTMVKDEPRSQDNSSGSMHHSHTSSGSSFEPTATMSYNSSGQTLTPPNETRDYLDSPEEVLFMQVFVEEVGLWMDSMDAMKHFSRLLPFYALGEPMLLNAFLACGARHLSLVNPAYQEDKALYYYDTATTQLLRALQNPDRDTVICATTAVILNVYEIMCESAMQRMNHIAGARALIKECGWSARSTGIGAACFWLNVGMEILSCLHFNWQVAWEPDLWGVDMDFERETEAGREEVWVHRIVYVTAKIANLRASTPKFQQASPQDEQIRCQNRYAEWQRLRDLCDSWNTGIPRTMHPMAYLYPHQTTSKSTFPEVWLIKRSTIVGRLFYHTAVCLLAQTNPILPSSAPEMAEMQLAHAHQICGIVAHVKDRGVASVALRSMAIAAEVLVDRREQEEVLQILEKISKETGWRIGFLYNELKKSWGWIRDEAGQQALLQGSLGQFFPPSTTASSLGPAPSVPAPTTQTPKGGILNPLLRTADFSLPNHPYQQYYRPPNQQGQHMSHNWF